MCHIAFTSQRRQRKVIYLTVVGWTLTKSARKTGNLVAASHPSAQAGDRKPCLIDAWRLDRPPVTRNYRLNDYNDRYQTIGRLVTTRRVYTTKLGLLECPGALLFLLAVTQYGSGWSIDSQSSYFDCLLAFLYSNRDFFLDLVRQHRSHGDLKQPSLASHDER